MDIVLLIDDNLTFGRLTARALGRWIPGFNVEQVTTCAEARKRIQSSSQPRLIILDWSLPDGDGLSLLKELRKSLPCVPIIVSSGCDPRDYENAALTNGAFDVLHKPFELSVLGATLVRALGQAKQGGPRGDVSPVPLVSSQDEVPAVFDRHAAINKLSAMLSGLRAFGADLDAEAEDPKAVRRLGSEYVERLAKLVRELATLLGPPGGSK